MTFHTPKNMIEETMTKLTIFKHCMAITPWNSKYTTARKSYQEIIVTIYNNFNNHIILSLDILSMFFFVNYLYEDVLWNSKK